MVKKRKYTAQSATLLDFFARPDNLHAKKTKLRKPPTNVKKYRAPVDSSDIITIDSDDDVNVAPAVGPHGIEIIDLTNHSFGEPGILASGKIIGNNARGPTSVIEGHIECDTLEPSDTAPQAPLVSFGDKCSFFGEPSELLCSRPAVSSGLPDSISNEKSSVPSASASSAIGDNLRHDDINLCEQHCTYDGARVHDTPGEPFASCVKTSEDAAEVKTGLEASIDYDWRTEDDELYFLEPEASNVKDDIDDFTQPEDVDVDLTLDDDYVSSPPPRRETNVRTCPLCSRSLTGMSTRDMHEHVNQCIDSTPQSSSYKLSTEPRSLARPPLPSNPSYPLSSLPTPHGTVNINVPAGLDNAETYISGDSNAFSFLMTSHKENLAWKEASIAEDKNFRATKGSRRRQAPFYKVMEGMPIAVDAFRYGTIPGVTAYFLTHAHSDHYTNLSSNWKSGPIYCSEGTANLVVHMLSVDRKWVHPLPMDTPTAIPDTGGVTVTLIEANHCPGSCLFLFEGPQTVNAGDSAYKSSFVGSPRIFRYLHCGDFRASPQHVLHPSIRGKRMDHVYLDTTYLDPKYCFPPQSLVISACAELARKLAHGQSLSDIKSSVKGKTTARVDGWFTRQPKPEKKETNLPGRTLVVVGTYSIGKERIVKAIAKALNTKVYCDSRKAAILRCQPDPELHALLTNNPLEAGVHLVPLSMISSDQLKHYVERWDNHFSKTIGFRPTGWTYTQAAGSETMPSVPSIISRSQAKTFSCANLNPMRNSTATIQVYGVPYSEHSSFFELTCFALSLDWVRMIATVNVGSENSRAKMAKWVERWEAERKKKGKVVIVGHRASDYW